MSAASNQYLPSKASELNTLLGLIPHPEGGCFLETFRSGSQPMSSRGQTDFEVPERDLVYCPTRKKGCRPDNDERRNCLTSIYWVPTTESPILKIMRLESDHVHYYHGGKPFLYYTYDPSTKVLSKHKLGPDIKNGQVLQVPVPGGVWKFGELLSDELPLVDADYCIIAEAVGPGFDFHDFRFVTANDLDAEQLDDSTRKTMETFLNVEKTTEIDEKNKDFDRHYD